VKVLAKIAGIFLLSVQLGLGGQYKSNLACFEELYSDILSSFFKEFAMDSTADLMIRAVDNDEANWLIQTHIVRQARQIGCKNIYYGSRPAANPHTLEFRSLSNRVSYSRREALASESVERRIETELFLAITAPGDRILHTQTYARNFTDVIPASETKKLENVRYPFTMPEGSTSLFSRLFEPAIVTMITGFVIYSFFTFRSK
jgi:hypothetical protein